MLVMALDVGTSSARALCFDGEGRALASASVDAAADVREQLVRIVADHLSLSARDLTLDESAVVAADLRGLRGVVAGVNVKLAKVGGVGPAWRMLYEARRLGFRTFLGCMEETSVGIAASAAVASLADWVDLDGCLLLAEDPFEGLELGADCRWRIPEGPGLGLRRRGS